MAANSLKAGLLQLDLTATEVDVYLLLAKLGTTSSGPLIAKSGLHRNVVYTALEHLVARKLVTESQARGKKQFSLADPARLVTEFTHKAEVAQEVAEEVVALAKQETQEITVHEGNDEYLSLLTELLRSLPKGATKYVLGTGGEDFMETTMRPIWKKYHRVAKEQGIKINMISYESQRQAIAAPVATEGIYEVRYLPDEIENPAGTHIYPGAGTILNIIYSTGSRPVTAIKIKNSALAAAQLHLFKNLWNIAKA